MILILSESQDDSTTDVIKWLDHFNAPWFRINEDDVITFDSLEFRDERISKMAINVNGVSLDLFAVKSYWYRRGWLHYDNQPKGTISKNKIIDYNLSYYLKEEIDNVMDFVHAYLEKEKPSINSFVTSKNNKTYYQYIASKVGLNIPNTIICTNKNDLKTFVSENGDSRIITKSINELFSFKVEDRNYQTKTYEIDSDYINNGNDTFFPTLFQVYIEKYCELRIFYLLGKFYPMAIFSQRNQRTKIDFRNYDHQFPNRNVPFNLPIDIELKLKNFMDEINLNCGSIDMILTHDDQYFFLEVNPVGQFGMVSNPCYFNLEKKIATALINHGRENV